MIKSLKIVLALGILASVMIGCSSSGAEDTTTQKDVQSSGEMPDKLKGTSMDSAGGAGGGAQTPEAPNSSPD